MGAALNVVRRASEPVARQPERPTEAESLGGPRRSAHRPSTAGFRRSSGDVVLEHLFLAVPRRAYLKPRWNPKGKAPILVVRSVPTGAPSLQRGSPPPRLPPCGGFGPRGALSS